MHILLIILLALAILYLLAIKPRTTNRPDYTYLFKNGPYYAHRGLHDNETDAPENSKAAFRKAIEAGYGIELDVQLTKDRIPVVFHDETLKRVCGAEGKVRDYTFQELQQFAICQSDERIPLFSEVLKLVDGKVPLIIEIKAYESANVVCAKTDELISQYKGPYCIESFHPFAVRWYQHHRPQVVRGQLSSNFNKPDREELIYEALVHYLLTNFLCSPDFIAYDHLYKTNISRVLCHKLYKALPVTWTVKSQEQLEACRDDFKIFIFEGFIPR